VKKQKYDSAFEVSLRPYNGHLWYAPTREEYLKTHKRIFKMADVLTCATEGRFTGGEGKDGMWTYLIWAETPHTLAHEISHAVLHTFKRCGIDPRKAGGEPFCYLLSQIILDINSHK
jgi:hypothetical protein